MAAQATDWRGNNNIAESIFQQMEREPHPVPTWVVCSAGTGGTSATIGRYARFRQAATRVCVVDPDHSVFFDSYRTGDRTLRSTHSSDIEGIGRPRVERSFVPEVIDRMIRVPDTASLAAIHFLDEVLGRRTGGSTGTNLWGALAVAEEMHRSGIEGSVVTLLCDGGERYRDTYYSLDWLASHGHDIGPWMDALRTTFFSGRWDLPERLETISREERP
jgi:cysteine synthase A